MSLAIVSIRSTKHPPETQSSKSNNNNTNNNNTCFDSKIFTVINAGGLRSVHTQARHLSKSGGSEPVAPVMFILCLLQAFGFATLQSTCVNCT